jgi:hypothetical protein
MLDRLKKLIRGADASLPLKPEAKRVEHAFLGVLTPHADLPDVLAGRITHDRQSIDIDVDAENGSVDEALAFAEMTVRSLSDIDAKARILLAADSLDKYNQSWRFGDILLEDGSTEPFEKPRLSREEFCANLRLETVSISGKNTITLWYDDNDMFWGHSLSVTSCDGLSFADAHASMAG